ncbi:winged helix-turn-helix domain-containing protein [Agrobacterium tumefaciens]|uniref:winged helix-turn-helix domain-containing protein n=1 Tax=Agrobacterium tumefaciens TaxID=358 RepID=UPI000DCF9AD7|nr:winged helix-turn-helix domain-containing protein [Agrobacterium tumefaciens]UXT81353.1 winged helix-turn-helix domain-containing protein [Agrobacterium tumefaciens]
MAKSDTLFVTEAQCAERLGLSLDQFKMALLTADKSGFPMKDPLFANRRYWPAVRIWLERRYGIGEERGQIGIPVLDGKENWR